MTTITRDDWLKALSDAGFDDTTDDQDAVTTQEFAEMTSVHPMTASRRLQALVKLGKAERTFKQQLAPDGRRVRYVAYKLIHDSRS
jgi:DeoR/GlpR family transcriptional regulator of sugar metabolism